MYPEYEEEVAFLAVGVDPSEEDRIAGFHEDNGFTWITSPGDPTMLVEYGIRAQASKVALDHNGIIVYKPGAGSTGEARWRQLFEELAAGTAS